MSNPPKPPRLRLRVSTAAEYAIRRGHPWLYSESIRDQNREGQSGELAVIYDRQDKFLAIGLFDPGSPLRVRIIHTGKPVTVDDTWWQSRLDGAIARREGLFDEGTTGYRLIHGESDGWPGLVLDRYGSTFVLKLYTQAWLPRWGEVRSLLKERLGRVAAEPTTLVLRLSRNIQEIAQRDHGLADGQVVWGDAGSGVQLFLESGLQLEAEVLRGQKTGFYLDQRDNRRRAEALARDRDVLNAFSFTGGFSIYAARGGARSVTDLDISEHAINGSRSNFARNRHHAAVARCRHECVQADAFQWLSAPAPAAFDLVVLDPPSLARRETDRQGAIRAYGHLASASLRKLRPGGILLAASCSAHVTADEFFQVVRESAQATGRRFKEMETTGHPADHPAGFPEARYLKAIYLQF